MSIKQHLQNALTAIQTEEERAIGAAKEKAMRENVIPEHNALNEQRDMAIAQITEAHNAKIAQLTEHFNAEKQSIETATENKKAQVTNTMIECATATVKAQYGKTIADLEEQISKAGE